MSVERVKEDIYVKTKLVELRVRSGEIIVTRLFSKDIHQPLVLFSIKNNKVTPCSPSKIKLVADSVVFDTDSNVHGNIKTNGRDAILIRLECYEDKVGFMFPTVNTSCFFGDKTEPIDKKFTTIASYHGKSDDPTHQQLSLPMLHLVDDSCLSISSRPTNVSFCHFIHDHAPYFNVISDNIQVDLRYFGNQRSAISHFYKQHGYIKPLPVSGQLDIFQMKRALYSNSPIQNVVMAPRILETAHKAQKILDRDKIQNCIIGSLAVSMFRSNIETHDVDIVVDSLSRAKESFKNNSITAASAGKWQGCSFRAMFGETQVDVVKLKMFDWNAISEVKGIKVLNEQGLLLMKLMGEFERSLMQPNYDVFKIKNQKNILSLFDKASFVYPFFADFLQLDVKENFLKLKNLIDDAAWDNSSLTATFPLCANSFVKGKETFVSVINNGSPCNGKIWIGKPIESGIWVALDGHNENCSVKSSSDSSEIYLPTVHDAGVIVCRNA